MTRNLSLLIAALALFFFSNLTYVRATVTVTYPFADSMVVQRNMKVPVWGKAASGEAVQVTFNGQTKSTVTAADGTWKVALDSMTAAGPLAMTIKGTNTLTIKDIYIGEVWNCAGQSNMDLRLYDYVWNNYNTTFTDTIKAANNSLLRYYDVRYTSLNKNKGWHPITPASANGCSATGYFFGRELQKRLGCAVGLLVTAVGGSYLEYWLDPATIASNPNMVLPSGFAQSNVGGLYNSFVAPMVPFAIRGTVCMHGEQNSGDSATAPLYGKRFESMIKGWRKAWGQGDFPFYYGQLTMFDAGTAVDTISKRIMVREGQRCAQKVPNTAMAVMVDLSASQWHFPKKYEAGKRLAQLALNRTYGFKGTEDSGPVFEGMGIQGYMAILHFSHVGSGLKTSDGNVPTCIMVAGDNNVWYTAATVIDGDNIKVYNIQNVKNPKRVCYGIGKTPISNIYNKENLPASEFFSDHQAWPDGLGQVITFATAGSAKVGTDFDPGAVSTSGLPIRYESSDTAIAVVTPEGLVRPVKVGSCKLKAYQPGDSIYRASITLTQTLTVGPGTAGVSSVDESQISLFPIPMRDELIVSTDVWKANELTILNVNGVEVLKQPLTSNLSTVNVAALPRGIYFVKLSDNQKVFLKKVVKL